MKKIGVAFLATFLLTTHPDAYAQAGQSVDVQREQMERLIDEVHNRVREAAERAADMVNVEQRLGGTERAEVASEHRDRGPISVPSFIQDILTANSLPPELAAVVTVESGGNPTALSPKGARGLWQLMPDTARRYGLRVDQRVDERIDPVKSTHAAVRYLADLYLLFNDWSLALAAYNAGENRVQRIIDETGIRQFAQMAAERLLPRETIQYVPAVLNVMSNWR